MNREQIEARIDQLLSSRSSSDPWTHSQEVLHGALDLLVLLYGQRSVQVEHLITSEKHIQQKFSGDYAVKLRFNLAHGTLQNLKAAIANDLLGTIQKSVTGEVLTDFIRLTRAALDENNDNGKNVAAVLAAAVYEDTIRRLAEAHGLPHMGKLQDQIQSLKDAGVIQGSQVGILTAYLNFRNNALHAQWEKVERESIVSVLGFVEQLLMKHFS